MIRLLRWATAICVYYSALPTFHFITSLQHNDFYLNVLQEINESIQKEMGVGLDELLNPAKVSYFKSDISSYYNPQYYLLLAHDELLFDSNT